MENIKACEARSRLAKNLRNLRHIKNKTARQVAAEIGFAQSFISSLENEEYQKNPSMETIDKLAQYYEVDISTLFI